MPQLCGRRRQPSAPPHTFHRTCLNPSTDGALLAQTRFTQVLYIFANEWTRSELDRLCHEAQLAAKSSLPKRKAPPCARKHGRGASWGVTTPTSQAIHFACIA